MDILIQMGVLLFWEEKKIVQSLMGYRFITLILKELFLNRKRLNYVKYRHIHLMMEN